MLVSSSSEEGLERDEFVFERFGAEETVETGEGPPAGAASRGEVVPGPSKSAKRRARKKSVQRREQKDLVERRVTKDQLEAAREKRQQEKEESRERQERKSDTEEKGWKRRFEELEEEVAGIKQELNSCFKRKPKNGGANKGVPRR